MSYTKTIVCFANSRKTSGRCVAGKEWINGAPGDWLRPVSSRGSHEVSEEERRFENGRDPQLLEIINIPLLNHQPLPHQHENHVLDPGFYWECQSKLPWSQISSWMDNPASLWGVGHSSYAFLNNRIPDGYEDGTSLYLISLGRLSVIVGGKSMEYPKRIVRGEFAYLGNTYRMAITDPILERHYLSGNDGQYTIDDAIICVSLGDPYLGYFYKLIAAILTKDRFE
jgi:hypothetical protein